MRRTRRGWGAEDTEAMSEQNVDRVRPFHIAVYVLFNNNIAINQRSMKGPFSSLHHDLGVYNQHT